MEPLEMAALVTETKRAYQALGKVKYENRKPKRRAKFLSVPSMCPNQ